MTEPLEAKCLDCRAVVTFDNQPGYTTSKGCGARLYLTSLGQVGVLPRVAGDLAASAGAEEERLSTYGPSVPSGGKDIWTIEGVKVSWRPHGRQRHRNPQRNPAEPNVPAIGDELAAARALSDLTDQLIHLAAHTIEAFEGHPVSAQS